MGAKRPHIIIFNPDEMRWDGMRHMGNPAAYTPNLDRFAEREAVSFRHAYCQNPVCVPSRCSFTTGLYPHVRGHRTMSYLLRERENSLFKELKDAGYHVWMNARNDLVAGQIHGLADTHADEIYYYDPPMTPELARRQQAQRAVMQNNHGYPYAHYLGVCDVEYGNDAADTEAAINRILHPPEDKPLCLFLGLVNPHPPYAVEREYYEKIDHSLLRPRIRMEDTRGKSRMMEKIREYSGMGSFPEELWTEMRAVYLAQCAKVDDLFGRVCSALKQAGIYDESAIFVLSDHGDFAGDYSLPEKAQNTFEDCLTRVPLLIKPPKGECVDPGVTDSIAELVDFYATVMDYAGAQPTQDHYGRSLRPVVENRSYAVRRYAFCEGGRLAHEIQCDEYHADNPNGTSPGSEYWARMMAQNDPLAHEKGTMITDGHVKFVERPSGLHELYLLDEDPGETTNRYADYADSELVRQLREELLRWYQTTCDTVPRDYDSRFTEERSWIIVKKMCPPGMEETVRSMIREGKGVLDIIQFCMSRRQS